MAKLTTLKVESDNKDGFIVINESDLTDEHKIFSEQEEVIAIEDMKKPQLLEYIKENSIEIPKEITKVDDIKIFLLSTDE